MAEGIFELLLLLGRPASGKSEIIDYLQRLEGAERRSRFHFGELVVLDDFPMLWAWLEEDEILQQMGKPRLHTTADGYFTAPHLWDLLIRRLCLEYDKLLAGEPGLHERATVVVEFSRGSEHGGYRRALGELSEIVLSRASALYVRVSFRESLRKNRRRFNPDRPHSVLEHSLPDEKMERLYRLDDWDGLYRADSEHLLVLGHRLPFVTFENEDDVTTPGHGGPRGAEPGTAEAPARGEALGERLQERLEELWKAR